MIGGCECIGPEEQLHARFCNLDFGGIDCRAFGV
jgi:hypothetical protein